MRPSTPSRVGYERLPSQAGQAVVEVASDRAAPTADTLLRRACCGIHHLFRELGTGQEGLRAAEAARRLRQHGPNVIAATSIPPWHRLLLSALVHPFNCILALLAAVAGLTHDLATTTIMLAMVLISTGLRFWQELKSTVAAAKLIEMVHTRAKVLRRDEHGVPGEVDLEQRDVVPGDVVVLLAGELFPGDVRLLNAKDLFVGEAVLTGESMPVEKVAHAPRRGTPLLDCRNLGFMGTHVVSGVGLGVVVATGGGTYLASMAHALTQQRPPNAFERGVRRVSWLLIAFMACMVPIVIVISAFMTHSWTQAALFGISVAVGLTPEMLPMVVNANLARGAVALSRQRVIVKRLDAIQNLGAMDVLCTDKTGTLTQDKVVLMRWLDWHGQESGAVLRWGFLNSYFQTGIRNLLDTAILREGEEAGIGEEAGSFEKVDELPFDFVRRRLSVILQQGRRAVLVCKGAMEETLAQCTHLQDGEDIVPLEEGLRRQLSAIGEHLNVDGLRVLAVAVKEIDSSHSALSMAGSPIGGRRSPGPFAPSLAEEEEEGASSCYYSPRSSGGPLSATSLSPPSPRTPALRAVAGPDAEADLESGQAGDQPPAAAPAGQPAAERQAAEGLGRVQSLSKGVLQGVGVRWSSRACLGGEEGEGSGVDEGPPSVIGSGGFAVEDEGGLTFVGFLAFLDPPKESAAQAVQELYSKAVAVKVLTGDGLQVAHKVCQQVGIPTAHVITGPELEKLGDGSPEFEAAVDQATLLAKLTPLHKTQVVAALKRCGHTVGFLGDGINDALGLRTADVGVSVDSGADIAKDAADVVLLEKSLLVLEHGVLQGRITHGNTIKYIKLTASSNFGNAFSILIASAWLPFNPMRPIQLLTQNLLYDLSQVSIPFDNMDAEYLAQPHSWSVAGIGLFMLCIGPISSIYDVTTFSLLWWYYQAYSPERQAFFQTGWFVLGLLTQTLIVHMIRTEHVPFVQSVAALPVITATIVISAIGLALPYTPVGQVEGMVPLPASYYGFLAATVLAYGVTVQLAKLAYIRAFKSWL